jgi:Ribbon-helix-helix protein, copG family
VPPEPGGDCAWEINRAPQIRYTVEKVPRSQVNIRLGETDRERLSSLAAARGLSQSETVRRLLSEADDRPPPEPPGHEELLEILGGLARNGSVRAVELLLRRPWERASEPLVWQTPAADDPFREVDMLRERRERERGRG